MTLQHTPFDINLPLERGVTVVQASAGTGKTWSIASLVARLVAEEGLGIDRILVMTFTKAATAELRDRIRGRLAETLAALCKDDPPKDAALLHLWQPEALRDVRRQRLDAALRDYDTSAVFTIHSFCQRVLQLHAFESQVDFSAELLDQTGPILEEIVDDYLSRHLHDVDAARCAWLTGVCRLTRSELKRIADFVMVRADVPLPPQPAEGGWQTFRDAVPPFAAQWRAGCASLVEALVADAGAGKLRCAGHPYNAQKTLENAEKLDAWLAAGAVPWPGLAEEGWGRYFLASYVATKVLKASPAPFEHPLMAAWEALTRQMPDADAINAPRLAFAAHVREELPKRLRQRGLLSFSDLLSLVHARVSDAEAGEPLRANLRERYHAVLIDEFQDTDSVQWGIFETVFAAKDGEQPAHHLYLIGDPKQAIYGFRGADVFVYSEACQRQGARRFTMTCNQRSDARYVAAMNALFSGQPDPFGSASIAYEAVSAAERNQADRLLFAEDRAPLQIRSFGWQDLGMRGPSKDGKLPKYRVNPKVPLLAAAEVGDLLAARPLVTRVATPEERAAGHEDVREPLTARHITVLVRKNKHAGPIRRALRSLRIAAIVCQTGNVWQSEAALTVLRWLEAVARPGEEGPTRLLAVSPLVGWSGVQLLSALTDEAETPRWAQLRQDVHKWSERLGMSGFLPAFLLALTDPQRQVYERIARREDGERWLTDLRHVLELLHAAATQERLSAAGLLRFAREQRAAGESEAESTQRRLESDADAVQVTTLHRSKGLQYPVVVLPYLWDGWLSPEATRFCWHDGTTPRLELNLCKTPERDARAAAMKAEQRQEDMRLLYVGFTRARHHCVALWGPVAASDESALASVLFGVGGGTERAANAKSALADPCTMPQVLDDAVALAHTRARDAQGRRLIEVRTKPDPAADQARTGAANVTPALLQAAQYRAEPFDNDWKRLSYTMLTRGRHGVADDEEKTDDDTCETAQVLPPEESASGADNVPLFAFPRGMGPGTYVHKVLELLDFTTQREQRRGRELEALIADLGARHGVHGKEHHDLLAQGLRLVLSTPLGAHPGLNGATLGQIGAGDRLNEWDFDLAVHGGEHGRRGVAFVDGKKLAQALALDADANVFPNGYLEGVQAMEFGRLAGYLTGSIDLAFRVGQGADATWFIADYKTNALGAKRSGRLVASRPEHFAQAALRAEMAEHDYFLQYHLYLTALHRYLQVRMGTAYSYERHVGGAVYLFVRGMVGPATPREGPFTGGVFFHKPKEAVIQAMSAIFGPVRGGAA